MAVPDGPRINLVPENDVFGTENVGHEIPDTTLLTYSGGTTNQARGFSSYIGQIINKRDIQPFNPCSNSVNTNPVTPGPACIAY